jgi:hypothetical protein
MDEWMHACMDEGVGGWMDEWKDGCMDEQMNGWVNECMDAWMNKWTEVCSKQIIKQMGQNVNSG